MKKKILLGITAISLLSLPAILFSQAPNLGSTVTYVLFSSNGAVSNAGTAHLTHLTGDVGAHIGAVSGFGNVNGVMHNTDASSFRAAADLLIAHHYLDTITPTSFHAPALGGGDTLNAGVYSIAGNTSLGQTLTLDAQGNANAVFIFKISAPFSTTDSAQIILINNAQACNVFWKVEGLVSLAPATIMKGTIVANNAAINMGTGVKLEGRALSTTGAISVSKVLAYTPKGCGSPVLMGPAAPDLASAACYALFTGSGAVANSDITYVTGDVGTNAGLTVGFDSTKVNGTIHKIPDGSTSAASADLLNAYKYLDTIPYDIELLYPAQLGHNLVLTPHSYLMNAATNLTDTLYLNAEGNPDAVFVIKVNGAFSTTTYAKVILINGAKAANVFWKVKGAVNLNDYSVFRGTIVCTDGAISLYTGITLEGRALTTNGAFSTASVNATSPSGACIVLPVNWLYFRGKPAGKNVLLEWGVTGEMNDGIFTIEKSRDGRTFETLTNITASRGRENAEQLYSFTDQHAYNQGYYRISQTDKDGQKNYFRTIQVKMGINQIVHVMHYVQNNYIYVQSSDATPGNGSMELFTVDGKKLFSKKILLTKEISTHKIEKQLRKGMYLLYVTSNGQKLYTGKVMVL